MTAKPHKAHSTSIFLISAESRGAVPCSGPQEEWRSHTCLSKADILSILLITCIQIISRFTISQQLHLYLLWHPLRGGYISNF